MPPLTFDYLRALANLQELTGGFPPTVRELGDYIGVKSTSTVQHHLDKLARQGLIERRGSRRVITELGRSALETRLVA